MSGVLYANVNCLKTCLSRRVFPREWEFKPFAKGLFEHFHRLVTHEPGVPAISSSSENEARILVFVLRCWKCKVRLRGNHPRGATKSPIYIQQKKKRKNCISYPTDFWVEFLSGTGSRNDRDCREKNAPSVYTTQFVNFLIYLALLAG